MRIDLSMTNALNRQRGFGYLLLLFALALFGVVLAGLGRTWSQASQRERETELLFIGHEFSHALASYRDRTPNGQPPAPKSLDDLVEDKRFPFPVRHLRRIYKDPITHQADWETVLVQGRIVAVHSRSQNKPLRENLPDYVVLAKDADPSSNGAASAPKDTEQTTYADWTFVPAVAAGTTPGGTSTPNPAATPRSDLGREH